MSMSMEEAPRQKTATGEGEKGATCMVRAAPYADVEDSGSSSFGLGIGFALSPELAQKVRECRGVSSAPTASKSSLTFLKVSPGETDVHNAATVENSEEEMNGQQRSQDRHRDEEQEEGVGDAADANEGVPAPGTVMSAPPTPHADGHGEISLSAASGNDGGDYSNGGDGASGGGGGRDREGGNHASSGGGCDSRAQAQNTAEESAQGGVARPGGKQEKVVERSGSCDAAREGGVLASAPVAEPPDSWEEFDESSVPSAAVATAATAASPGPAGPAGPGPAGPAGPDAGAVAASKSSKGAEPISGCSSGDGGGVTGQEQEKERVSPQSLPVLLVDLARVCGFRVKGAEEAEAVGSRVRAVLHESFAERSEELFETGSAVHADTSTLAEELRRRSEACPTRCSWAIVDYPPNLGPATGAEGSAAAGGGSTAEAWAAVTASSASRAVEAVRTALVATNRHLAWKRDMLEQLEAVAASERRAKEERINREREEELEAWRRRRREQLEKLIEVRPMFERRRAMAEEKLLAAGGGNGGVVGDSAEGGATAAAAADPVSAAVVQSLDAKLESIDDLIARLEIEEGEEGYGFVPSDDDEDGDNGDYFHAGEDEQGSYEDDHGLAEAQASAGGEAAPPTDGEGLGGPGGGGGAASDAAVREKKEKRKKRKKKKGRPGVVEQLRAKAASSPGAGVNGAAPEESKSTGGGRGDEHGETPPEMSLLDAVAAMILGRYPQDPSATNEQHFQTIAAMHRNMKEAWLAEFGRLPPMPASG